MLVEKKIRKAVKILDNYVKEDYTKRDVGVCLDRISINEDLGITVDLRLATAEENVAEGIRVFVANHTMSRLSVKQLAAYYLAYVHEAIE